MDVKIIEFTDKITVTYKDGSTKVFVEEVPAPVIREVSVPIGVEIKLKAE